MPYPNYILDVQARGGEDFISIVTAEADMQGEFTDSDPVTLECRDGTETVSSTVNFGDGWTAQTGVNSVTVKVAAGYEHGGVIGGPSYILKTNSGFHDLLRNSLTIGRYQGFQTWMTNQSSSTHIIQLSNLINNEYRDIIGRYSGTSNRTGEVFIEYPGSTYNCVFYCDTSAQKGLKLAGDSTVVENCTFFKNGGVTTALGIERGSNAPTVKNCVVVGFGTAFPSGLDAASTNNASSDATAGNYANGKTGVVKTAGVDFVDPDALDLTPAPLPGKLDSAGVDLPETDPDVAGNARVSPWEIGAYEIAGAAPGVTFDGPDIIAQTGTDGDLFVFDENGEGTVASRFTGATSYTLAPTSDALPTGLTVNVATGNIQGTPTEAGTFNNIIVRGSENSPEALAAVARFSAISAEEEAAVLYFVDGCVADGIWDKLDDFWCFALNGTDWLTGWKANTCTITTAGVARGSNGAICTGGVLSTGVDLGLQTNYQLGDAETGIYVHTVSAWGAANFDFFGVEDGTTNRTRARHRGDDVNDMRNSINTGSTHDSDLNQTTELPGTLVSMRDDGVNGMTLFDGVKQVDANSSGTQIPTGFDVRIFSANNSGSNSQGPKNSTFTSFYVGAEIDTLAFLTRLKALHTALGVS